MEFWKVYLAPDVGAAGSPVATSQNYVNPNTGDVTAFDTQNTMSPQNKTWYQTESLKNARSKQVFTQFAKNQPLPANHGMSLEVRKPNTFPDVQRLTEGVIPEGLKFGYSAINMAIYQYGHYAAISDRIDLHAIDPVAQDITEEMGASGGETMDKLARNIVLSGSNVMYCPSVNALNTEITGRNQLDDTCTLTPDVIAQARTWMKKGKVPDIDGKYVAIIHPSVAYDLRKHDDWVDAHKYAQPNEIYNGEIGELHGFRFIEADNAKVFWGADLASNSRTLLVNGAIQTANKTVTFDGGTVAAGALEGRYVIIGNNKVKVVSNTTTALTIDTAITASDNTVIYPGEGGKEGCAVYGNVFLGKDAFAIIDAAGGSMEMIHKTREQAGGPLNQFETIGIKFETGGGILYESRILRVECGSKYSDVDTDTDIVNA